jgi:hypothetical protein
MLVDVVSELSVEEQVNRLLFSIILTVDSSEQEFVNLCVFVAHLTNDSDPRSPVYYKLHVCYKKLKFVC